MSQFGPIASGLFSDNGANLVIVSASPTPSAGQLLTATSPTGSEWDDPSITLTAGLGIDPVELSSNNIQLETTSRFTFAGNALELSTVTVPFGGTGQTTLTTNAVLIGDGVNPVDLSKSAPTGDFIGTTDTQTLTNKTMTDSSNDVTGTGLFDSGAGTVTFDAAANPTAGQRLTATSPTVAEWQDPSSPYSAGLGIDATQLASDIIQVEITARFGFNANALQLALVTVPFGGTQQSSLSTNRVLVGDGTSQVDTSKLAPTGDFVGTTDTQVLTNKTITASTNDVTATGLFSNGSTNTIDVSASANPVNRRILTATGPTAATWQNQSEIFYAYDTVGGVALPIGAGGIFIFPTVYANQNGSNYVYDTGTGILTINDLGVYEFNYTVGSRGTLGSPVDRTGIFVGLGIDTGGGFAGVLGSVAWAYGRQINTGGCRVNPLGSIIYEVTTVPVDFAVAYGQLEDVLYETQGQASRFMVKKIT